MPGSGSFAGAAVLSHALSASGFRSNSAGERVIALDDSARARLAFGDFALDPRLPVAAICQFYGLTAPEPADARLDDWMATAIGRPPVVGDRVALGTATLFVRELDGSRITGIGLALAPEA